MTNTLTRVLTRPLSVPLGTLLEVRPGFGAGVVLNVELVVNGGFDTNTDGWLDSSSGFSIIASVSGELVVTSTSNTTGGKWAFQEVPTDIGGTYEFTGTMVSESPVGQMRVGPLLNDGTFIQRVSPQTYTGSFVATSTSTFITLLIGSTTTIGSTAVFDNISLQRTS